MSSRIYNWNLEGAALGFPIEYVISEARSRGLVVQRIPADSKIRLHDPRLLLIDGRRCQVIPTHRGKNSVAYPQAEYFSLYLPRTTWADFLIYVAHREMPRSFYIVPRGKLSKDTGWAPESLAQYQDAWEWLEPGSQAELKREFESLSWQLKAVIKLAQGAGKPVELLRTKKSEKGRRWPEIIKRRVLISGRRCAIHTAARLSQDDSKSEYNYVMLKVSADEWAEFHLYVIDTADEGFDVFIIPSGHLQSTTSCSLDNPKLVKYTNSWDLLIAAPEVVAEMESIQWRTPKPAKSPTKHSIILAAVIREAEKHGLIVEPPPSELAPYKGVQSWVLISKRRCQVIWTNPINNPKGAATTYYVPLNPPNSDWAEFLIFYVPQRDGEEVKYYVIPRSDLPHATSYSPNSKRLRQYEGAWYLLNRP
jgi:hypothetical protein